MRKIINGKKYDTETAVFKGSDSSGGVRDFNHWREALYQKKNGEFFMYCEGGPLSRYAIPTDSGWSGGEEIVPVTEKGAKRWAEEHLTVEEYEAIFGEVEE